MANDIDMMKDINKLLRTNNTPKQIQQGYDLNDLYFYKYMEPNLIKLNKLKKLYIKQYKFLDNYI